MSREIASRRIRTADAPPHRSSSPSPICGSPREKSKLDRLDADSSACHSDAEHEANARARVSRTPVAAFAIVPFAVVGVIVMVYLTWWGMEMGSRIPGGGELLLGIAGSVAVPLAAILIGWRERH